MIYVMMIILWDVVIHNKPLMGELSFSTFIFRYNR